ncbi:glycine--tRNA ligase subunit beta [Sandaracinobacteroides saxicola]|uniref:Glycine--tRNA ligase beta subunit n=2 Tax=Sandaracinobacteroides saxicola TaxID=2759707 RepID=A0A7G5ILJ1_9SPHN|nr:glycine--tRNA ligase subunit beta [Sandaracinobacteroides saxicola]QMW24233.1 glycine--tRNA ligase subunit beta [Sandaracinobacteroides saxicola]
MSDFLLELFSEEIPARMQADACARLKAAFEALLADAGLGAERVEVHATPRRLALLAWGLPAGSAATREERRGPRADAPEQAIAGFLKSTGLAREALEVRDDPKGRFLYAVIGKPGAATGEVLRARLPGMIEGFGWPKSMRWGAASVSTASPRWVRPLRGIVALLDGEVVPFAAHGVASGRETFGHRFMGSRAAISVETPATYQAQLRAGFVVLDAGERAAIIREGAARLAASQGFALVPDAGLEAENAGLTEWPVPLLGRFDPAFLSVPREVIQLTMRTNQKYFAVCDLPLVHPTSKLVGTPVKGGATRVASGGGGAIARSGDTPSAAGDASESLPLAGGELGAAFICVANIDAADGGARIVAGNERVLSARLADARFFWERDLAVPLEDLAPKLGEIVFHAKLGSVADKVERVAKLARWLIESGAVPVGSESAGEALADFPTPGRSPEPQATEGQREGRGLFADLAERAARLAKCDLVTGTVGEFPEVQGIVGGYLAAAQGEHPEVAGAIRDQYRPAGQGDEVPTAPVSVALGLADRLDTLSCFFVVDERPTGSKDPYALRRAAMGIIHLIMTNQLRFGLDSVWPQFLPTINEQMYNRACNMSPFIPMFETGEDGELKQWPTIGFDQDRKKIHISFQDELFNVELDELGQRFADAYLMTVYHAEQGQKHLKDFLADRIKVQQRERGTRHDVIDAISVSGDDDLVRLVEKANALQRFLKSSDGADLFAGYRRAANILRMEEQNDERSFSVDLAPFADRYIGETEKNLAALFLPAEGSGAVTLFEEADALLAREDFEGAMGVLARLRGPVDAFFETVRVNDPDPKVREARLALLAAVRDLMHRVADFSKIEG